MEPSCQLNQADSPDGVTNLFVVDVELATRPIRQREDNPHCDGSGGGVKGGRVNLEGDVGANVMDTCTTAQHI